MKVAPLPPTELARLASLDRARLLDALARHVTMLVTLRSQTDELRDANARHEKTVRELEDSERRFRMLAEHSTEMIVRYALDGSRLYVSPASREILGYEPKELVGKRRFEITHPEDLPRVVAAYERVAAGTGPAEVEAHRARRSDGRYVWLESSVRALRNDAGQTIELQTTTRDVTARKQGETLLVAQHTMTRILAESDSLAEAAPRLVETLCRAAGCEAGVIWEIDSQDSVLRAGGAGGTRAADAEAVRGRTRDTKVTRDEGILGRVWTTAQSSWDPATGTDAPSAPPNEESTADLRSVFAVPLIGKGAVVGVVEIFSRGVHALDNDVRATVEAFGVQIGTFIVRLRGRELQHRLVRVLETTSDFVGITDGRGRSLYLNKAGRRMLEIPETAPIADYSLFEYQPAWANTKMAEEIVPHTLKEGMWSGEFSYRTASGEEIPVSQVTIAERNARGTVAFFASVARDITEMKKVERLKSEFVSTVSHELRTPLTSIRGALGLLEGGVVGELSAPAREIVQIARSNSERLIRLINDMLDLEKIEAGRLEMRLVLVPSDDLVGEAFAGIKGVTENAGVHLERVVTASATLRVDTDRVVQVLVNLLSNAVKFSPRGRAVTLRTERRGARLRFEVIDRGPGIPEAERGKLFRKFQQLDSSDSRAKGGTGLGLSISKAIVEQLGGAIGLESVVGEGATFWFELPVAAGPK